MSDATSVPRPRRLRLSPTLTGYIARQFTLRILGFLFGLAGVIFLIGTVDLLDRFAHRPDTSLGLILEMALLKPPYVGQEVMPFAVLFAGMATFWQLSRSQELIITRATGISIWQSLLPVIAISVLLGIFTVTIVNPLAASLLARFERLESRQLNKEESLLSVSRNGLWLRQADAAGRTILHAERVAAESMALEGVTVFRFVGEDRFAGRIDAARGELLPGAWRLYDAWISEADGGGRQAPQIDLPSELTPDKILESFAPPETISFWKLPGFLELLQRSGFSAQRHRLHLHRLLAMPLLFAAMVLFAAAFALRPQRRGKVGLMILAGLATGFLIHASSNFVFALGLSAMIPAALAGWAPATISALLGITILFHLEDG